MWTGHETRVYLPNIKKVCMGHLLSDTAWYNECLPFEWNFWCFFSGQMELDFFSTKETK